MRAFRNVWLVLFALLALGTVAPAATGADECLDVSGVEECVSCDEEPDWKGTCYSSSDNCGSYECGGSFGSGENCEGGGTIYLCSCEACVT